MMNVIKPFFRNTPYYFILNELDKKDSNPLKISKILNKAHRSVYNQLINLSTEKYVTKISYGKYSITEKGKKLLELQKKYFKIKKQYDSKLKQLENEYKEVMNNAKK